MSWSGEDGRPVININVVHGSNHFNFHVPFCSTFEDVKILIAQQTGLEPKRQRLYFRGKEKEDEEYLDTVGVKENAKILLMEDPARNERQLEETNNVEPFTGSPAIADVNSEVSQFFEELDSMESTRKERKLENEMNKMTSRGCAQVDEIRREVDKLAEQVTTLEAVRDSGSRAEQKEHILLTELLMRQLLKLDTIEAEGEGKVQRKLEVRRVQEFVDKLDSIKVLSKNPFSSCSKVASVTSTREKCEFEMRSPSSPSRMPSSSTKVTQDWEQFD